MKAWIGVVARSHVEQGIREKIAQLGHGTRAPLARLSPGDWLIYYSSQSEYPDGEPVQAFTAIGRVPDDEIYEQVTESGFHPFRRRVEYVEAKEAPIKPLLPYLSFSRNTSNWGMVMRRGLVEITIEDVKLIAEAMGATV
ncbi:EVE domain-containing protein [Candidatus Saccharibacteria bacterium]|nr:EVE domain-containing protein [Candidatus Saccharibacteria bacterium]